jgi:hypothetical protein
MRERSLYTDHKFSRYACARKDPTHTSSKVKPSQDKSQNTHMLVYRWNCSRTHIPTVAATLRMRWLVWSATNTLPLASMATPRGELKPAWVPDPSAKAAVPLPASVVTTANTNGTTTAAASPTHTANKVKTSNYFTKTVIFEHLENVCTHKSRATKDTGDPNVVGGREELEWGNLHAGAPDPFMPGFQRHGLHSERAWRQKPSTYHLPPSLCGCAG